VLTTPALGVIAGQNTTIVISYETNEESESINWLNKEQTAGKDLDYMFT